MRKPNAHAQQLPLQVSAGDDLEAIIEARVAARCEAESIRWKFQLVAIETVLIGTLVGVAGLLVGQPPALVVRAALLVAASCFATGLMLLGLSVASTNLLMRLRRWRAR